MKVEWIPGDVILWLRTCLTFCGVSLMFDLPPPSPARATDRDAIRFELLITNAVFAGTQFLWHVLLGAYLNPNDDSYSLSRLDTNAIVGDR